MLQGSICIPKSYYTVTMLRIKYTVQNHAIKTRGLMRKHGSWYILASEGRHRVCGCSSLSHARLYVTLCTVAHQAPLPHKGPQTRPPRPGGQKSEITESAGQTSSEDCQADSVSCLFPSSWWLTDNLWHFSARKCLALISAFMFM